MEPAGTPATPTPAGVLAAQDAIVFSGAGAEGVTPPAVAPAVAPASADVFWASLARAQLCVWELEGAIEGQTDGGDRHPPPQDIWHRGHGATAGSVAMAWGVSAQRCSPGSAEENVSPMPVPTGGSILSEHQDHGAACENIFHVSTGGSIPPKSMATDETIFHEHQGPRCTYRSTFHVSTDGTVSPKFMPVDKNISPKSMAMDETVLQEHQGHGSTYKSTFHVSTGGTVSPKFVPVDKNISPKSMATDGSIFHEHHGHRSTYESIFHVSTDGTVSPKSVPVEGSIFPDACEGISHTATGGNIPNELRGHVPTVGSVSPWSTAVDGNISPMSVPMDETTSQEHVPVDGTTLPKSTPTHETNSAKFMSSDGNISHERVPEDGTISYKSLATDRTISLKSTTTDGTISPKFMTTDGTISPKFMPTGGTTSPEHQDPECSEEEEEDDDEEDDGSSSREEDAEEEEDLEEEEPHFHTNPLFQSRVLAPMGAQQVPLYRPHSAALQPLLITEGDDTPGGTGEGWGCPPPTSTPPPLGCHPAGGDIGSAPEQGPPRPPGLVLCDPPDLPPGSGDPHSPLQLQPEWGDQDPPRPPTPLEDLTPRGGDRDPPSPSYPPSVAPGGGEQDLSLPRPLTPPKPPLGGGYQPPTRPPTLPVFPQGGGHQIPPNPPDLPQKGRYQPPTKLLHPRDLTQEGGFQKPPTPPDLPPKGGYQPLTKPLPPPDLTQEGGYQRPPTPPYQPMAGGFQAPPSPLPPLADPQPPPSPLPPSPLSSLPPRGPPGSGVIGVSRGGPPMPGHGCAWLPASPGASCPGGEVAQGPPPVTPPPHPAMEELPPATGEEPPPDPPASTHGCPPGGSAVAPALANGGQGRRGEARRLATRLFHLDGFKRSQVASFLRKNNDFSGMVAQEYLDFFQFGGQTLDQALRSFLQALVLTGETQERERILGHFSRRYHRCNPGTFPSPDAVHSLTCAIMLLNTDLHGQRLGRAMTSTEFVANLSGMMDGQDFPREQLKALYSSIRSEKLAWAVDEEEEEEEEAGGGGSLAPPGRKKSNPFLDLPGGSGALIYRRGWLARKVLAEADGKKTPWGRRGWKPFQAVLKGTVLYFLKPGGRMGTPRRPPEPGPFPAPQEEEGPEVEEPLGVHHALAERASKYTKRPNVFRLQTADWRVFLFQAPTLEEMFSWISRINLVAALFSSPPFPAAVGSQRRFVRPILPAAPSRSPPEEQHRSHEAWMERVGDELFEHQRNLPEKRGRARDLDEYRLKKEYLLYERRRYETYVQVLETWINAGGQDVEGWEAQAGPAVAPPDHPTLTKAHSSPSLAPEPPVTPTIRVKRNISERRTVRKIVPKRNKNLL
ncbi:uncharacterized protein LOC141971266 isoform X1 [Athene noctua]|uniref:uncharacterized protein LOC141971266 isoform X1 n=1 Tax=Athene noctua TaxID=126797 RepID=UPI003EBD6352